MESGDGTALNSQKVEDGVGVPSGGSSVPAFDVIVIGAGFAGLYALKRLRDLGYSVLVCEAGSDVGGVWYWNRYPGARCDVESLQYSYSFSKELEQEWEWSERYASQPEILRYLNHVADRFELRRDIRFQTRVESAIYDESHGGWTLSLNGNQTTKASFCVMASGGLSVPRLPDIPGIDHFAGKIYHTGQWPHEPVDFTGIRVGVIGTGSSGIQVIPKVAAQASKLVVFQRTANFSVPARNAPLSPEVQRAWKAIYHEYRARARQVGTIYEVSEKRTFEVTEEERQREYQRRWDKGGVNVIQSFRDVMVDKSANDVIADFVRARIRATVKDTSTAEALCPVGYPLGAKRICVDTDYFETYNRPNVELVDLKKNPISRVDANGVATTGGYHELDALICATGYDALTGALLNIDIRGRGGMTLRQKWSQGPRNYLGLMTGGFPNMFIVTGPGSPSVLANVVVGIEHHIEWIADCINFLRANGVRTIEATPQAEDRWVEHVNKAANKTLFPLANSWWLGANVPGKPRVFMPYVVKFGHYRRECQQAADNGYEGFALGAN